MKKYFLFDGTTQHGPFDMAELEAKIITAQTMVWFAPLPEWKPAGEIDELKGLLNNKVPASQITSPPVITVKEEDWSKKSYYYTDDHGQQGPFSLEQLKSRAITAATQVWYDPLPEWTTAGKVEGLKNIINPVVIAPKEPVPQEDEWSKKQFYYTDGGAQQGPFTLEQLKSKSIKSSTPVWYHPLSEWTTAGKVAVLKDIINNNAITPQVPVPAPPDDEWSKKQYYYIDGTGQHGPFSLEQLKGRSITAATSVWYAPLTEWTSAGKVAGLRDIIS